VCALPGESSPARRAQGILSTGVISPAGVLYVSASTKNADGSVSWVRCRAPALSCPAPDLLLRTRECT